MKHSVAAREQTETNKQNQEARDRDRERDYRGRHAGSQTVDKGMWVSIRYGRAGDKQQTANEGSSRPADRKDSNHRVTPELWRD